MESYFVYQHKNMFNGKSYIGITKQVPEQRWGNAGVNYKNSPCFWAAIQKYGWDCFEHIIIASGLTKDEACDMEVKLIKELKTQDREYGYNMLEGGTAPSIPTEVREKMSVAMRGNQNGVGHPCSDEKKKKIGDAQRGRKLSPEHIEKLSKAKKGKSHGPLSAETRQKISDSHKKKRVYCQETREIYPSIQHCARELGVYATYVCRCCKGTLKSTGGYHFEYYDAINA